MKLRDYQQSAIDEIRAALKKYRWVLFQLNTGGGKSLIFSTITKLSQEKGTRVLILSNRTEILKQNGGTLERVGLDVDFITPKSKRIPTKRVVVGMAQTLRRRIQDAEWLQYLQSVEMIIVDEAHCCDFDFVYPLLSPKCFRLLVTATPRRQGNQNQLGDFAHAMVIGINTKELIKRGYLSPARHFTVAAPKLEDVAIDNNSKEYNQKSLAKKFEDKTHYKGVIDEWYRLCKDKKTLIFCVSAVQAIECTKLLIERGINAKYVLSGSFENDSMYSGDRSDLFDSFKRGDFQVLVNVGIAVAGTDVPDIECIVANYATTSISKWRQSIGRGCRISPGKKEFYILDAGDNIRRLGFFETEVEWSLWHNTGCGGGLQVMKDCPTDKKDVNHQFGCGARVPASCKVCPACGYKFPTEKDNFQLHLEEVSENEEQDLVAWAAKKKLEGWNLNRILIQCCLANPNEDKKAFTEVYTALYPQKTPHDVAKYWHVFKKQFWERIKGKSKHL